ncbi:AAA family ATPase [Nocardia cyriacigeorgica]|uniref:AAA family ATPase n=1 Tax=Nocardia cyriacigeorgica TaxID=135487 RepID=UPI001893C5D3|nr:ATP-binding protein [Nocardia cyriacigeorgica]MBF6439651.1 ATP-binding protein [Nocardia cyriacigeorgica]
MAEGVSGAGSDSSAAQRPTLIVVSGPPGSGKTTLAHALAQRLGVPAVIRDEIKQGMVLAAGREPEQGWDELNIPTLTAFFNVLEVLVRAGVIVVAEAAFQQRLWAPNLMAVAPVADIRIVHCTAAESVIRDRIAGRAEHDPHRRAHNDSDLLSQIAAGRHSVEHFESVDLGVPALTVDTTDGYHPGLEAIARFAVPSR